MARGMRRSGNQKLGVDRQWNSNKCTDSSYLYAYIDVVFDISARLDVADRKNSYAYTACLPAYTDWLAWSSAPQAMGANDSICSG